jgi:predicted neutral ceramidase superfamily lipid hydrolase
MLTTKIVFRGNAIDKELVRGVIESVKELAEELDVVSTLNNRLASWTQRYQKELLKPGFSF